MPLAFALRGSIAGLNAPSMRLALVLLSIANDDRRFDVDKPRLEAMAGVRLHNAERLLSPLLDATISTHVDDPLHGQKVFGGITYERGIWHETAGIIRGALSDAAGMLVYRFGSQRVSVAADELREYGSIPALVLRLRLGAAFLGAKRAKSIRERITTETLPEVFGAYAGMATIKRKAGSGESVERPSLSRAGAQMIKPAVAEINDVCRQFQVAATHQTIGARWAHIDVIAKPLSPSEPVTLASLKARSDYKARRAAERC